MVSQPHSALARTERYISRALEALRSGNAAQATEHLEHALGAVAFAGNSQTKLIDSLHAIADDTGCLLTDEQRRGALDAITHAEGSGID